MLRIIKNFFINFGNLFRKPRTVLYPREKIIVNESSRGQPRLKLNFDTLEIICNGCGDCGKACPQNCISIRKEYKDGSYYLDEFCLDLGLCSFCGNCVEACKIHAIEQSYKYQMAEYDIVNLKLEKLDLIKQAEHAVRDFWIK
ncbi:MAG: 4Fe-4S dicluster domain-containing protein [Actinomycetota bacterium]|nr:4Fe-4S dicluster domain-containing protein [Actinomycetota bacterium]